MEGDGRRWKAMEGDGRDVGGAVVAEEYGGEEHERAVEVKFS